MMLLFSENDLIDICKLLSVKTEVTDFVDNYTDFLSDEHPQRVESYYTF